MSICNIRSFLFGRRRTSPERCILITGANSHIGISFEKSLAQWPQDCHVDNIDRFDDSWRQTKVQTGMRKRCATRVFHGTPLAGDECRTGALLEMGDEGNEAWTSLSCEAKAAGSRQRHGGEN